jgi:hypothetical protein
MSEGQEGGWIKKVDFKNTSIDMVFLSLRLCVFARNYFSKGLDRVHTGINPPHSPCLSRRGSIFYERSIERKCFADR